MPLFSDPAEFCGITSCIYIDAILPAKLVCTSMTCFSTTISKLWRCLNSSWSSSDQVGVKGYGYGHDQEQISQGSLLLKYRI